MTSPSLRWHMCKSLESEPCSLPSTAFIRFLISSENTCRHCGLYLSFLQCYLSPFTSPTCSHPTLLSCRDDLQVIHHSSHPTSMLMLLALLVSSSFSTSLIEKNFTNSNPGFAREAQPRISERFLRHTSPKIIL
jgi:hypothetical protein